MADSLALIQKYFDLTGKQEQRFQTLKDLYVYWNERINLISRKDTEHLFEKHILHSLGIAKVIRFKSGSELLDVGTGGGFPGIPLAIMFEDSNFHLVDSILKKIKVVKEISRELELDNITSEQIRAEKVSGSYDFVISRAVTRMKPFYQWIQNKLKKDSFNELENGILYLKGGELEEEMNELKKPYQIYNLSEYFEEPFFETKKVVYVPR